MRWTGIQSYVHWSGVLLFGAAWVGAACPALSPAGLQESRPNARVRRAVVLVLPEKEADAVAWRWITAERTPRKPRRALSSLFSPPAPPSAPIKTDTPKTNDRKLSGRDTEAAADRVTPDQLRAIAEVLFSDELAKRLRSRWNITVAAEAEVQSALRALRLAPAEVTTPENAQRLCERLDCDALLIVRHGRVALQERATRALVLRADVWGYLPPPLLSLPPAIRRVPGGAEKTASGEKEAAPAGDIFATGQRTSLFSVAGMAFAERTPFHAFYRRTKPELAHEAARRAAAYTVHLWWTGEAAPLVGDGERLAIAPTPAPTQADKLLFTPRGRQVLPAAVRDLPADVSSRFAPQLLPMFPEAIRGPEVTRGDLQQRQESPATLWATEGMPDTARVQALGRRLGVDYVLLAHVTDIEVSEGPPMPSELPPSTLRNNPASLPGMTEARAEGIGALVRVADGKLLWHDRATATMTLRPFHNDRSATRQTDRRVAEDATRFALIELQRRFLDYRARFER